MRGDACKLETEPETEPETESPPEDEDVEDARR